MPSPGLIAGDTSQSPQLPDGLARYAPNLLWINELR